MFRSVSIRSHIPMVIVIAWLGISASRSVADDWMYRRSYYSHAVTVDPHTGYPIPSGPVPRSRTAYRPPVTGYRPGFVARGGMRINTILMRSGYGTDMTIIREDWGE